MTAVRNIRNLIMILYFIAIITVLLGESRSDEAASISRSQCYQNFTTNGKIQLQFKEECENYYINIDLEAKISIINLTLSIQEVTNRTNLTENYDYSEEKLALKVAIYETTVYTNGMGMTEDILQQVWEANQNHMPVQRNYLSRTSSIYLVVSSTGNWTSYYDIIFSFHEIQHSLIIKDDKSDEGKIEDEYLPNSITLYRLTAETNKKWEGIEITVEYLNISKEMGEYLLIGEGTDVFKSKDYLPLYVTDIIQNSTFYIGNSSAYIAFVSGSVEKTDNRITFLWGREETKPFPEAKEDPLGVLNSSLICFYNYSAAIQEFDRNADEQFKLFRQNFAEAVKVHGKKKYIDSLDETSVKLFGHPTQVRIDNTLDALSILLKIMYDGKSVFTWNELQDIIEKFEKSNTTTFYLGYRAGKCPQENSELPYKDKWSFLIYAFVPLFGFFALMIWAWRNNIFAQKCTPEKEEKLCPAPLVATEPNAYQMTIPKVCLYDGDCRRGTLIPGSTQQETEDRDEETVEMNVIPSTSPEPDTLSRYLTSRRSRQRPSIQSLIEKNEETTEQPSDRSTHMGTEYEHLYDSVNSRKVSCETKL